MTRTHVHTHTEYNKEQGHKQQGFPIAPQAYGRPVWCISEAGHVNVDSVTVV